MKRLLLSLILLGSFFFWTSAQETYYTAFYDGFLNAAAEDYPSRRREALEQASMLPPQEKEKLRQIVVDRDLTYMSYAHSFEDLWKLRYHNKWEDEVLIAVAETAKFYLRFQDSDIDIGPHQEVGVLHYVLQQLRKSDTAEATRVFKELAAEIEKRRVQRFLSDKKETEMQELKQCVRADMEASFEKLHADFIEALKLTLMENSGF